MHRSVSSVPECRTSFADDGCIYAGCQAEEEDHPWDDTGGMKPGASSPSASAIWAHREVKVERRGFMSEANGEGRVKTLTEGYNLRPDAEAKGAQGAPAAPDPEAETTAGHRIK